MDQSFDSKSRGQSRMDRSFLNQSVNRSFNNSRAYSTPPKKIPYVYHPDETLAEFNKVKYYDVQKDTEKSFDLSYPQRLQLPPYFNTPSRVEQHTKKPSLSPLRNNTKGRPISVSQTPNRPAPIKKMEFQTPFPVRKKWGDEPPKIVNPSEVAESFLKERLKNVNQEMLNFNVDTHVKITSIKRLKDYQMLSLACRRGGKVREEGRAYYSMGVLYDNMGKYKQALNYYRQFLAICKSIGDTHGEALAYNCLGVDFQMLGDLGEEGMYQKAIEAHSKHRDLADNAGKFIAHVNLGIVFDKMGDKKNSTLQHQQAFRIALSLSDPKNQSIALGNLGKIGQMDKIENPIKTQMFIERYINLCQDLNDQENEGKAYYKLGQLLTDQKNFDASIENYRKAMETAEKTGINELKEFSKAGLAISIGLKNINTEISEFQKKYQTGGSRR